MGSTECPDIRRSGITVLWGNDTTTVDIVLLHGLNGSPASTWKHPSTGFYWPWELRHHVPDARIMVSGYDAYITPQLGTNLIRIRGLAEGFLSSLINKRQEDQEIKRPLIFIAHSLGGLIVKKVSRNVEPLNSSYISHALVLAAQAINTQADDAHLIYLATKGLIFLGTICQSTSALISIVPWLCYTNMNSDYRRIVIDMCASAILSCCKASVLQ